MGPFRRRLSLTLLISVMASPALAEVCYKERPDWDGIPVTLESEALALFLSPAGLFLLGALAVAVLFRHAMGTAIVALLWSFFISFIVWPDPTGLRGARISEGCEAQPTLFIVASAALCLAAVLYAHRGEKRL
ncbi:MULTISPECIES: hypothetical protein [Lentibacter]|jgi:hypothetical protein|uniref:Uncharacterized protein n=1 Tax=Lentibacter algarum TaxID=576131 RepID=A0A1H3M650_9RHOB|nr:hypothetical protein [Lentibacter algarum]MCO4776996.1 hypothetical protein [Lentibacter algarum]WIF32927.1 hypothetical protein LentiSH36_02493 [Lentibacter algarum]SDY71689.1 hypothetical protein SAMN05444486_103382 [Lentibacter algarum]